MVGVAEKCGSLGFRRGHAHCWAKGGLLFRKGEKSVSPRFAVYRSVRRESVPVLRSIQAVGGGVLQYGGRNAIGVAAQRQFAADGGRRHWQRDLIDALA